MLRNVTTWDFVKIPEQRRRDHNIFDCEKPKRMLTFPSVHTKTCSQMCGGRIAVTPEHRKLMNS